MLEKELKGQAHHICHNISPQEHELEMEFQPEHEISCLLTLKTRPPCVILNGLFWCVQHIKLCLGLKSFSLLTNLQKYLVPKEKNINKVKNMYFVLTSVK